MPSILMKRLFPSFLISVLLLSLALPCFTMEHAGNHAYAVTPAAVHAHVHTPPASPTPSHDAQDPKRETCCHDNLVVAFYGKSDTAKSVLSATVSNKAPVNDLLSPAALYQFTGVVVERRQTYSHLSTRHLCASSLYSQKTAFLL